MGRPSPSFNNIYIYIYPILPDLGNIFWRAVTLYYLGENLGEKGIDSGYAYILYIPPKFSQVYTHVVVHNIIIKFSKDLSAWRSSASAIDPVYSIALNNLESF